MNVDYVTAIRDTLKFLAALAPYGVSIVALAGTILANRMTGKNMIAAEQERARLAEIAENKRALSATQAEDRRAAEALKAEGIRHENEMRRATRSHLLDIVRDLYVELEQVRRELAIASRSLSDNHFDSVDDWKERTADETDRFHEAAVQYLQVHDTVKLLGSPAVSARSSEVFLAARAAMFAGTVLVEDELDRPIREFAILRSLHFDVQANCDALLDEMRHELHPNGADLN